MYMCIYNVGIDPLEGVVMLASTNHVDILDQALLRPGRFDRQILINLPTLPERKAIFEVYLKKILLEKWVDAYSSRLAALTPGHSGMHDDYNIVVELEIFPGENFHQFFQYLLPLKNITLPYHISSRKFSLVQKFAELSPPSPPGLQKRDFCGSNWSLKSLSLSLC